MRILHLDSGREMRGGQWQVLYLLRGLRDRGHQQHLLARAGGELLQRAAAEGFAAGPLSFPALLRHQNRAGVVHAHDARSHTWAALAGLRPLIVSRRVAFPVGGGAFSRWKYRRAAHYIAISRHVAEILPSAAIQPEAVSVVYDGVPRAQAGSASADGPVIAPATSDPMKGSDLARDAARLAGVDLVFSSDLPGSLRTAGLFLYLTRSEGLGSAILLAMAYGVPVLASRIGGVLEAVEEGITGVLVDNSAAFIATALRKLLEDAPLRARLGEAGRARVEREFSLDTMVQGTIRVYEQVQP